MRTMFTPLFANSNAYALPMPSVDPVTTVTSRNLCLEEDISGSCLWQYCIPSYERTSYVWFSGEKKEENCWFRNFGSPWEYVKLAVLITEAASRRRTRTSAHNYSDIEWVTYTCFIFYFLNNMYEYLQICIFNYYLLTFTTRLIIFVYCV